MECSLASKRMEKLKSLNKIVWLNWVQHHLVKWTFSPFINRLRSSFCISNGAGICIELFTFTIMFKSNQPSLKLSQNCSIPWRIVLVHWLTDWFHLQTGFLYCVYEMFVWITLDHLSKNSSTLLKTSRHSMMPFIPSLLSHPLLALPRGTLKRWFILLSIQSEILICPVRIEFQTKIRTVTTVSYKFTWCRVLYWLPVYITAW